MSELTQDQLNALNAAHVLVDMGAPIFSAFLNTITGNYLYPADWQNRQPTHKAVEAWQPGKALCMVTGVILDVIDEDPRNGGDLGALFTPGTYPHIYAQSATPSAGRHLYIGRTHLAKGKPAAGIDLQAGADDGTGRGFVFLPPTERISKHGQRAGQVVAYRWTLTPTGTIGDDDPGLRSFIDLCVAARAPRHRAPSGIGAAKPGAPRPDEDGFFDQPDSWDLTSANKMINEQLEAVRTAQPGGINNTLGGAARVLGRFVAGQHLTEDGAAEMLLTAIGDNPHHSDSWNIANGKGWTAATCIGAGLARGQEEVWTVTTLPEPAETPAPDTATEPALMLARTTITPKLEITSAADMTYWVQSTLGASTLAGYFVRGGRVVHTPRIDEDGYVPPTSKADHNGPVQIHDVTGPQLAAQVQFAHHCYKTVDVKDPDTGKRTGQTREVAALFPLEAAKRAVDAPAAMGMLRHLAGITHTPMMRADGTVLDQPGYDPTTGYLFLPGEGVDVPAVPEQPTTGQVAEAVAMLDSMTAGFPWCGQDDRANYYGLLLTPLLRLLAPPAYKMFGIGAHQPGSGKTLLADIATILHGGVLRSEMPDEEAEVRKLTTSVLANTAAPVVVVDNVTGVLKSSTLAGILTAGQATSDRELGSNRMLTTVNDRVWVVTGNNLSIGGDLVRRTITILIDPDTANPEARAFDITDLKGWAREHRNRLLWALLVMIRRWVASGSVPAVRAQSDSYATWEACVAGILQAAGVPGAFDNGSGQRAAAGGDDDGLAGVLEHVWALRADTQWTVADLLSGPLSTELGDFIQDSRDWLPSSVLDKLARSEPAGRKSFGYWLRNRLGRWVTGQAGAQYVIRNHGQTKRGQLWSVQRRG